MTRILTNTHLALFLSALTAILSFPFMAGAAFNDVTLTTAVSITAGGDTLDIKSTSAIIESIEVGASSFTVVLPVGSEIQLTSPGLNRISSDAPTANIVSFACDNAESKLALIGPSSATTTVVITPSTTSCVVNNTNTGGGSGGGGGGGGGGGSSSYTPVTTTTDTDTSTDTATETTSSTGSGSTLSEAQVQAILDVLRSFDTDMATLASVEAALRGTDMSASSSYTAPASTTFTRDLDVGSTGEDVKALQQYLNSMGFTIASAGVGSPGNETTYFGALTRNALAKFQAANGISPAVGYFGPLTRSFVNGGGSSSAAPAPSYTFANSPDTAFNRDLDVGSTGEDVLALQKYLNENGFTVAEDGPGSSGNETSKFGALTRAALAKFQQAVGIAPAVGYFGPMTRDMLAGAAGF
jgi:peptidoglycan hydrolase-like protein with peptidoglycan-binding domain